MIKLIIADDHKLIRDGLRKLFSKESDIEIVAETDDPLAVLELVRNTPFDILMLDLNFPQKSGLDLLIELKLIMPDIKVLILSMHSEKRYGLRLMKAGAMGYMTKESDPSLILEAVRKIYDNRKFITPQISELLVANLDHSNNSHSYENLSDREFQVFQMIAEGFSQKQIADKLNLSSSTISTYRTRILEKLNLESTSELIHYAIENGLIN